MSKLRKLLALFVAAVTALAVVPAFAAGTGTITITPPTNTPSDATNTYKIYKVFDADGNGTNISYKLPSGKTLTGDMTTYFEVDSAGNVTAKDAAKDADGNLTSGAIAAIASYVTESDLVDTVTSTGTANATKSGLANGYYYITTSTGTAVTITSTNPDANVNDKGTVPSVDKKITGVDSGSYDTDGQKAIAQVGSKVSYESDITVAKNTKNLKFNDTLGTGLSLDTSSVEVKVDGTAVDTANYTLTTTASSIDITFPDSYINTINGKTIVITYKATITSDALTKDAAKNTASITYGDNNAKVTSENKPEVYNGTITVDKTFQGLAADASLANNDSAQFVLTKTVDGATKYYKITDSVVSWVDTLADATKVTITKNGTGDGAFTGLADGTYTLVESKVPAGYNKAADKDVTIANGTYTEANLSQTAEITNNTGSTLPSTGGMGTTIFTVVGSALVVAAGALLVTRKRMEK